MRDTEPTTTDERIVQAGECQYSWGGQDMDGSFTTFECSAPAKVTLVIRVHGHPDDGTYLEELPACLPHFEMAVDDIVHDPDAFLVRVDR